jgi:hypothetical protein
VFPLIALGDLDSKHIFSTLAVPSGIHAETIGFEAVCGMTASWEAIVL